MKRSQFLLLAGVLACLFGFAMVAAPGQMLANMTADHSEAGRHVLRWMGCVLLSVGIINIIARDDPGSPALLGVMLGNVLIHTLGLIVDIVDYATRFVLLSGLITDAIVHVALIIGFLFYLRRMNAAAVSPAAVRA